MNLSGLLKASAKTLLTTVAITGVGFFSSVITARVLGPEGRGLLSAALFICTLAASVSQMGLANAFVYHKGTGRFFDYRALLTASLVMILAIALPLAYAAMCFVAEPQLHMQLWLILCAAVLIAWQNYFNTLSQLRENLHFYNLMRFGLVFGNFSLLLALVTWFQPVQYVYVLSAQLMVAAALVAAGIAWSIKHAVWSANAAATERVHWREVFTYGASQHGTVLLGIVLVNFDKIALLKMGSIVQFGFYAVAFTTSRLIGAAQEAVATALYSRHAGRDSAELALHVREAFRLTFLPLLVLAAIGAALAPWLIVAIYGAAFAPIAAPFSVLLFECVISGASWVLAQQFNAGGRPGLVLLRQFISVIPVFVALPFLPTGDLPLYLSVLMLCGATLRLLVTLAIYPLVLKQAMPRMVPTRSDFATVIRTLRKPRSGA